MLRKIRFITTAAVIGALYAAITLALAPLSYGQIQLRLSEILTVLPFYTPAAIPGLAIGCLFGNLASPLGPVDIIAGTLATLLAAFLTHLMPTRFLAPLPPILCNAVIVGIELHVLTRAPLIATMLYVGIGEAIVCMVGGYVFIFVLEKFKATLFGKQSVK